MHWIQRLEMKEIEEIINNWSEELSKIYNALSLPKKVSGFLYLADGQELGKIAKNLNMARTSFQRYIESYQQGELIKKGQRLGEYHITERGKAIIKQMKEVVKVVLIKELEKKMEMAKLAKTAEPSVFASALSVEKLEELLLKSKESKKVKK